MLFRSGSTEEHHPELADVTSIAGMPVVAASLHSQVPGVVTAIRHLQPQARIAYVMTDAAALPLALSDLVAAMQDRNLIDLTVTSGHAFGGDLEAVGPAAALLAARVAGRADVVVVAMGPGIVGTGTRFGHTGTEAAVWLDTAAHLGGVPIAALRTSFGYRGDTGEPFQAVASQVAVPFRSVDLETHGEGHVESHRTAERVAGHHHRK